MLLKDFQYFYRAIIHSAYDGDGIYHATVHFGLTKREDKEIRLYGADTPELRGTHKPAGIIVRDHVRSIIEGQEVIIRTKKDKNGKYGRLLADVFVNGVDLAEHLISIGYAKPYKGGRKDPWTIDELERIINVPFGKEE